MSRIYSVLFADDRASWVTPLERLVSVSESGKNRVAILSDSGWKGTKNGSGYTRGQDGTRRFGGNALIGCTYRYAISLPQEDPGPFFNEKLAISYNGVVAGYDGAALLDLLSGENLAEDWNKIVAQLEGQFSLIAVEAGQSGKIYFATRAKPLYAFTDPLGRGALITNDVGPLGGLYHVTRNSRPYSLRPYSCGYLTREGILNNSGSLITSYGEGTLVLSGGGLDTAVAAYAMKTKHPNEELQLVYFDYGAHSADQEILATTTIADSLRRRFQGSRTFASVYELPVLGEIAASSLIGKNSKVSHSPQAGRASEWVPARNLVLISLAVSLAESSGYARIVTGINADAATAYPDNDEQFIRLMQDVLPYSFGTARSIQLVSPLGSLNKIEIVEYGEKLEVPWAESGSWSCYEGGKQHCGECSSCRARRKAFTLANVTDTTEYQR